jgi:hypothetical protein
MEAVNPGGGSIMRRRIGVLLIAVLILTGGVQGYAGEMPAEEAGAGTPGKPDAFETYEEGRFMKKAAGRLDEKFAEDAGRIDDGRLVRGEKEAEDGDEAEPW